MKGSDERWVLGWSGTGKVFAMYVTGFLVLPGF